MIPNATKKKGHNFLGLQFRGFNKGSYVLVQWQPPHTPINMDKEDEQTMFTYVYFAITNKTTHRNNVYSSLFCNNNLHNFNFIFATFISYMYASL